MKTFYQEMDSNERETLEGQKQKLNESVAAFSFLWNQTSGLLLNHLISDPIAYGLLDALADSLSDIEKAREDVATIKRVPL